MSQQQQPEHSTNAPHFNLVRRLWRMVENLVFVLVLLLIGFYFVLQSPVVQNWIIQKVTAYLSEELKTEVRIENVRIEFFDNLVLDHFYVADRNGDTLLYAGKLVAGLNSNFFALLDNKAEFNEISLHHARFNIKRGEGQAESNLQFIIDYFRTDTPEPKQAPRPFNIKVQKLELIDVEFLSYDVVRGQKMFFNLPSGLIRVNELDLVSGIVDLQSVNLSGLLIDMESFPSKPLSAKNERPPARAINLELDTTVAEHQPLLFTIADFDLSDSRFEMDKFRPGDETTLSSTEVMNFDHLLADKISIKASGIAFNSDLAFTGVLQHLAIREKCGFEITHAKADRVVVNDTITALYGSLIQTPRSSIGDSIVLHYGSYGDYLRFNNKVALDLRLNENARLHLGDIMHFSSGINNNRFFIDNREEIAEISGLISGRINRLRGRNLNIRVGPSAYMRGDFDGDDLAEGIDRMRLSFDFKRLQSDISTIRKIVNGFTAPEYFNRLGNIGFSGKYFIFFGFNHVLTGQLDTELGAGSVDMELDLTGGKEKATYSGYLSMKQFDLGAWTDNRGLGKTTFRVNIAEGSRGLTLKTIKTTLNGTVDTFHFKGYNYKNIVMNGTFDEQVFNGNLGVDDPNIDFTFVGTINLQDTMPDFDFKADIRRLDLGALNLVSEDWVLSGKVEKLGLRFSNLSDLTGEVRLRNFRILQDRQFVHRIDTLVFSSAPLPFGLRSYTLKSDVASGYMEGRFDAAKLVSNLGKLFSQNYPKLAAQMGLPAADSIQLTDQFKLRFDVHNSKDFTKLFVEGLDTLRDVVLQANVNADSNLTDFRLSIPDLGFRGFEFHRINVNFRSKKGLGAFHFSLPETTLPGQQKIAAVNLYGSLVNDVVKFGIQAQDTSYIVKSINLNGELSTVDSLWEIHFNPSNIVLFNEDWGMDDDNYVRFGNEYFAAQNFDLMNGNQRITLDSFNNGRGLSLAFSNFDLNFIDKYFKTKAITYRGRIYDFDIKVGDIFKLQDMNAFIATDTVFIKGIPYGEITGNLEMANLKSPLRCKMFVIDNESRLRIAGVWVPNAGSRLNDEELGIIRPGEFQTHISTDNFPLEVLEIFVPGISKTAGMFDADVRLGGPTNRVGMQGSALIKQGQFQLDYLKTMYHIKNQTIKLSNYQIWADGDTIYDASERNAAIIRGGLRHNFFKDWQLECEIESLSNNFMILNTRAEDNNTYYGQGIGKFKATFTGSFVRTNIAITATTGKETRLYIPVGNSGDAAEANFITFKNKSQDSIDINKSKSFDIKNIKGVNFEMNLTITDDAEVQLIFDEQAGDVVKGRGEGDIIIAINREGDFKMYGNYTIKRGEYLFTLLNWINKPFTVAEGGTINWYGDPYGAQINLDATYDENTSLYNLLRDELESTGDQQLITEASIATRVIVTMHLKGDLIKPNITFDMAFPNLLSRLKSLAENKLRMLNQDQNELTRQVFGLIVVGSFLPSNSGSSILQSGDYLASAFNTLTQVLSNQFSNYLSGLASEWFGGKVSSIDFDIAYNEYRNDVLTNPSSPALTQVGREVQVRLTSGFANDRVTINVGSQFGVGYAGTVSQSGFLGEDVTVGIQLTENREWRLKVYQRTEPDIAGGRTRSRYGFGLSFRRDYGSFTEMMDGLTGWFKG